VEYSRLGLMLVVGAGMSLVSGGLRNRLDSQS